MRWSRNTAITDARRWFGARARTQARRALANTPKQLPVLAKAGVVDAGAQGFVDLLEGIGDFMANGHVDAETLESENRRRPRGGAGPR